MLAVVRHPFTIFNLCSSKSARDSLLSKKPSVCLRMRQFRNSQYCSSERLPSRQEKDCTENLRMYLFWCFINSNENSQKQAYKFYTIGSQYVSISTQIVSNKFLKKGLLKLEAQVSAAVLESVLRPVYSQIFKFTPFESRMTACSKCQVQSRWRLAQRRVYIFYKLQRMLCLPMVHFLTSQMAGFSLYCTSARYSATQVSSSSLRVRQRSLGAVQCFGRRVRARGLKFLACSEGFWQRCLFCTSSSRQAWKALAVFCCLASFLIFQNSSTDSSLSWRRGWITFGINNDYNQRQLYPHLNYMHAHQPTPHPPPSEEKQEQELDWEAERRAYYLGKVFRIARKYHSRSFMTNFKSSVLQRLLQDNSRHQQTAQTARIPRQQHTAQPDWPYRSLLLKPNKSEHQLLEIQFVSMCAEKIQSVFKGYLQRKRFTVAFGRARKFAAGLGALVRGWKVRCVMRCLKVQEQMRSLRMKRAQLEKELVNATGNGSKFSQRRLQYLRNSLQAETDHFRRRFFELYEQGAWVYEPRMPFPSFKRVQKWPQRKQQQVVEPMKQNNFNQAELQMTEFNPHESVQDPPKKKRVRQMRDNAKRARNREHTEADKQQEVVNGQKNNSEIAYSQATTTVNSIEDRPIQAKGAYSYAQIQQHSSKIEEAQLNPVENADNGGQNEERRAQLKKVEKKKLQKRQKYDPRKAIEQQKKRKKQLQQGKTKQQVVAHSQTDIRIKPKTAPQSKEIIQSKSQRILKLQKEEQSRSTVNLPKNKTKVEAKIDCWGNRKTVAKKAPQQYIKANVKPPSNTNIEIQQEPQYVNRTDFTPVAQRLAAKINQRRGKGKERLQYSQQREKARLQIQKNCQESQRINQELRRQKQQEAREAQAVKQLKAQAYRQRTVEQPKQKKKDMVYRSVEQLTETYKNQYLTRFQNLYPKLSLLAAARNSQQHNHIPVLTLQSEFVERMMEENRLNQRFWYTVSKMERKFRDFVKG